MRTLTVMALMTLIGSTAWADSWTSGGTVPSSYAFTARARNGNTGFEATLCTPTNPCPAGVSMDPGGTPIWNTGGNQYRVTYFDFQLAYTASTGTALWAIDFNRDGDYLDSKESVTSATNTLGQGFSKFNLWMDGNTGTAQVILNNFTINGTNFGSFSTSSSATNVNQMFTNSGVINGDILATGQFTFTGNGGSEIPRIWLRPSEAVDVPTSVPDGGTTLALLGGALTGLAVLRRKFGV